MWRQALAKFGTKRKCFVHIVTNPMPPFILRKVMAKKPGT
jgi:hypothetical protein